MTLLIMLVFIRLSFAGDPTSIINTQMNRIFHKPFRDIIEINQNENSFGSEKEIYDNPNQVVREIDQEDAEEEEKEDEYYDSMEDIKEGSIRGDKGEINNKGKQDNELIRYIYGKPVREANETDEYEEYNVINEIINNNRDQEADEIALKQEYRVPVKGIFDEPSNKADNNTEYKKGNNDLITSDFNWGSENDGWESSFEFNNYYDSYKPRAPWLDLHGWGFGLRPHGLPPFNVPPYGLPPFIRPPYPFYPHMPDRRVLRLRRRGGVIFVAKGGKGNLTANLQNQGTTPLQLSQSSPYQIIKVLGPDPIQNVGDIEINSYPIEKYGGLGINAGPIQTVGGLQLGQNPIQTVSELLLNGNPTQSVVRPRQPLGLLNKILFNGNN